MMIVGPSYSSRPPQAMPASQVTSLAPAPESMTTPSSPSNLLKSAGLDTPAGIFQNVVSFIFSSILWFLSAPLGIYNLAAGAVNFACKTQDKDFSLVTINDTLVKPMLASIGDSLSTTAMDEAIAAQQKQDQLMKSQLMAQLQGALPPSAQSNLEARLRQPG